MPTESAEDGLIVEDLISVLKQVLSLGQDDY